MAARAIRVVSVVSLFLAACAPHPAEERGAPEDPSEAALVRLRAMETSRRASTDFAHLRPLNELTGPNPYVVRGLPSGDEVARFAGALRGRDAIVLLDATLHETQRIDAPISPTAIAIAPRSATDARGDIFVAGEGSNRITRFRFTGVRLEPAGGIDLDDVLGLRDLAIGPEGVLYAVDERGGRLLTLEIDSTGPTLRVKRRSDIAIGKGAIHVARVGPFVLVDCLLDHTIVIRRVDAAGRPIAEGETRIHHDGPMWAFDAIADGAGLLVATAGVEDHPLDRTGGSFGYIDSFVHVYRVVEGEAPRRLAEVNTSALGVVTPKWLALHRTESGGVEIVVTAYGSDRLAVLGWGGDPTGAPDVARSGPSVPGVTSGVVLADGAFVFADPLLDAWVLRVESGALVPSPIDSPADAARPRLSPASRVGEALFYTTLMAPSNKSDGELSRFTCETCHFEGYVDGRTHHTGRGDIRATTKPLIGLFNNRPHFSRALDPDLTAVANNEFRVAGARSDHDPWFSIRLTTYPWLGLLGVRDAEIGPEDLRASLMSFLMESTHRSNLAALARVGRGEAGRFAQSERAGAEVFRDRCERCHASRLISDDPSSRIPFEKWESFVFAPEGAIVWGRDGYEKTGVVPYVHDDGARVPSLRRLYKKSPYFTNGSASDLAAVVERAREDGGVFFHDGAPPGLAPIGERDRAALLAFLDLL